MIQIDPRSSKPLYEQIIDQIKENMIKGIIRPGDKLPSVRELSAMITANPNTVSKAYQELERQKVIETLRGKGTFAAHRFDFKGDKEKMDELKNRVKNVVIEAHYLGMNKNNVLNLLEEVYSEFDKEGEHDSNQ